MDSEKISKILNVYQGVGRFSVEMIVRKLEVGEYKIHLVLPNDAPKGKVVALMQRRWNLRSDKSSLLKAGYPEAISRLNRYAADLLTAVWLRSVKSNEDSALIYIDEPNEFPVAVIDLAAAEELKS